MFPLAFVSGRSHEISAISFHTLWLYCHPLLELLTWHCQVGYRELRSSGRGGHVVLSQFYFPSYRSWYSEVIVLFSKVSRAWWRDVRLL